MKTKYLLYILLLCGLASCEQPATPSFANYARQLAEADSLVRTGEVDSIGTARMLNELHTEYSRIVQETNGKQVRVMPCNKRDYTITFTLSVVIITITSLIQGYFNKKIEDRTRRSNALALHENEMALYENERRMDDLCIFLGDESQTQEAHDEAARTCERLEEEHVRLHQENLALRKSLQLHNKRPIPYELELLREQGERLRLQDEQVRTLTSNLIDSDALMQQLRNQPRFLDEARWQQLRTLTDNAYNRFTQRLIERFPRLTEADRQLCLLMRLRFTNAQIAILTAVSPATVSQQKFRLKRRMMQTDESLFQHGESVDMIVWSM